MRSRAVVLFSVLSFCLLFLTVRILSVTAKDYSSAAKANSRKTVLVAESRGKIYDRRMKPLVDGEEKLVSVFTPSIRSKQILSRLLGEERAQEIIESKKPYVSITDEDVNDESICTFRVPERYPENALACHLVGYVDPKSKNGVSGIERGYNDYLTENSGKLFASFSVDASGGVLQGVKRQINDENYSSKAGVVLTIDSDIQRITENVLENSRIKSGCALVMHVESGEILSMASVPEYDRNNLEKELEKGNAPLVNKALRSYSVGSVFKSVVAAYALECGIGEETEYICTGTFKVGDTVFSCYHGKKHGRQKMKEALQNSCNTYFIQLFEKLDAESLLMFCRSLGLSAQTKLAEGIIGEKGCLPESDLLNLPGERANFSFGQGKLLITPVQMLAVYHALATGYYVRPTVAFGLANKDGLVTKEKTGEKRRVLSEKTVKRMRNLLASVVSNGNAKSAKSRILKLAGKTGTAQSGVYDREREVCRTWFCGFFPAENPHYIAVILNEDGEGGAVDCAPVFKDIAENIVNSH